MMITEDELVIVLNNLFEAGITDLELLYPPKEAAVLNIDIRRKNYEWKTSEEEWTDVFKEINSTVLFPSYLDLRRIPAKLSTSIVKGLDKFIEVLEREEKIPYVAVAVDTNLLYNLLFSRHFLSNFSLASLKEFLRYGKIIISDFVMREINRNLNEENKHHIQKLNKKHKLRFHPRLTLRSRRARLAFSEYVLIKKHVISPKVEHAQVNQFKQDADSAIVRDVEEFSAKNRIKVFFLSGDELVAGPLAEAENLPSQYLEFLPPKNNQVSIEAMGQLLYLLSVELGVIEARKLFTLSIIPLKNSTRDWNARRMEIEIFDKELLQVISKEIRLTRIIRKALGK